MGGTPARHPFELFSKLRTLPISAALVLCSGRTPDLTRGKAEETSTLVSCRWEKRLVPNKTPWQAHRIDDCSVNYTQR